jgi:hypothetical protein
VQQIPTTVAANNFTVRRKEFHLRPLYSKRKDLLLKIPDFWPTVFGSGPEELQQFLSPDDLAIIAHLKSFAVERYQIESETTGEPRSLRFTFDFGPNEFFQDSRLVKTFEYRPREDGPGSLISTPIAIRWKNKKKDVTQGLLDVAVELYNAEEALRLKSGNQFVDVVDREALWQHEKLLEKMAKIESANGSPPSFFNWFGFRGAVDLPTTKKADDANGADDVEEDEDVDEMLEVEIFPAGEEVAIAIAEELWSDAMDHFVTAQDTAADFDGFEDEDSGDDDDAPELVEAADDENDRPRKKQRKV